MRTISSSVNLGWDSGAQARPGPGQAQRLEELQVLWDQGFEHGATLQKECLDKPQADNDPVLGTAAGHIQAGMSSGALPKLP